MAKYIMSENENSDSKSSMGEFSAQGYQYEPEYSMEEWENIERQQRSTTSEHERSSDLSWCHCGECMTMPTRRESTCCQEFEHYMIEYLSQSTKCITRHPDFN